MTRLSWIYWRILAACLDVLSWCCWRTSLTLQEIGGRLDARWMHVMQHVALPRTARLSAEPRPNCRRKEGANGTPQY